MNATIRRQSTRDNTIVAAIRQDETLPNKDLVGMLILIVVMIVVLLLTSGSVGG